MYRVDDMGNLIDMEDDLPQNKNGGPPKYWGSNILHEQLFVDYRQLSPVAMAMIICITPSGHAVSKHMEMLNKHFPKKRPGATPRNLHSQHPRPAIVSLPRLIPS